VIAASDSQPQSPSQPDGLSWYAVPDAVKQWLKLAAAHWQQPEVADGYINQALVLADGHPDVLVSAYRYFFYTHNYPLALHVATRVMEQVQQQEALPADWQALKGVLGDRHDDPTIRLYINAYAASSLIRARLGEIETAKEMAARISELEHRNEFGGKVVQEILERCDRDDEGDEE